MIISISNRKLKKKKIKKIKKKMQKLSTTGRQASSNQPAKTAAEAIKYN